MVKNLSSVLGLEETYWLSSSEQEPICDFLFKIWIEALRIGCSFFLRLLSGNLEPWHSLDPMRGELLEMESVENRADRSCLLHPALLTSQLIQSNT